MGKDNFLNPATGIERRDRDRDERDAVALISRIDEMLESGSYDWAEDTLSGIRESVERTGRSTEGQRTAVDNIENARGGGRW